MKIQLICSTLLSSAVVSASVETGLCSNGAQISAFPRHMPFARHGMYFSSWRLRTAYLNHGGSYPGGSTDWKDTPIVIKVIDKDGNPAPGCRVIWRTGRGQSNGWILPTETLTDVDGTVRAAWVAGSSNQHRTPGRIGGVRHDHRQGEG